jgi:peptide/nickel transport system permease protein
VARDDSASGAIGVAGLRPAPLRRALGRRPALIGLAIVAALAVVALAAPALAPYDPTAVDAARRLEGPSLAHLLGTDNLGRDVLSRLVYGSRWSLGTVVAATAIILSIGVAVGVVSGYVGGALDELLVGVTDVLLALPSALLALAVVGILGPGVANVLLAMVSVWWVTYARVVRGLVVALRERGFIEAVRALGAADRHIIVRHVLPNVLPPVIVLATLEMGELLLALAALNFLGLGAQPPTPEWGAMLSDGRPFLFSAPQLMVYPGLAISLVVLGFNLLGDGLRDALDPKVRD